MKQKSFIIIAGMLGICMLISCSNSPGKGKIEKLPFIQVMTEYLPAYEGIEVEGTLDTSSFTNPTLRALGYGMKFYRIDTSKVPVKVKSMGKKQEDGTWLALIEITIEGTEYVAPTKVYYDYEGKLHSSMVSR